MGVFTFNNLMAAIQSHGLTESFLLPMILNMSITGSLTILFVLLIAASTFNCSWSKRMVSKAL